MALPKTNNTQEANMRYILFVVFISLFVVLTILTILSLFFGVTQLKEKYEPTLMTGFVMEVGVAIIALFYGLFGIKKGTDKDQDRAIRRENRDTPDQAAAQDQPIIGIDKFMNEVLKDELVKEKTINLISELQNLTSIKNPLFQEAISIDFTEFLSEVKNWVRSSVKIQGNENDNFVIKLYRGANENVFSTCVVDYLDVWQTDFGEKLLDSHRNNGKCSTKRFFIFHSRDQITQDIIEIIKKQKEYSVTPYILLDETEEFVDFTIIDNGEVIGITNEMKYGRRLTTWYFDEPHQKNRFNVEKETILNKATHIDQFKFDSTAKSSD